ncbi:hypothetical protein [Prosthecobacter sp.]|uniref:hypothetical protein n=1 Tax=Prosthecobacter sp. TaxID=1965333 RepID=UPI001D1E6E53|nr:hypothetical protein [Prosthecobacter sp.]MCB1275010.1 hypothetical protein [Prosthecobacter sp.]
MAAAVLFAWSSLAAAESASVGNEFIQREVSWVGGRLSTISIANRAGQSEVRAGGGDEFAITMRTEGSTTEHRLTASDFTVSGSLPGREDSSVDVRLAGHGAPLDVVVRYSAKPGEPWIRKQLIVTAREPLQITKAEVEHLGVADGYAPYQADQFTARGAAQWRPPLGQPVYTRTSGTWWGIEFPAARNEVKDGTLICGYLTRVELKPGETWKSHPSMVGVSDSPTFIKDAFLDYIDATRARPLRLQTQYNCWFDYGKAVDTAKFTASVRKLNEELVTSREMPPLRAYVIDDGWQDTTKDWSKTGVWPVNAKFENNFAQAREEVARAKSALGLWLSPGCVFGGQPAIPKMREAGWRTLDPWMSMTGDAYMDALEKRMVELAASGVAYFKLDGVFGHLNTRNFDVEGFKGSEAELNDARYDEAKERYLSLGSERLMKIFKRMGAANPNVYIVISNGAFLSPWWLQHVDAVWMINAGDAAKGADRTGELVYRDAAYFKLASTTGDNTQFPLNSLFNHEPKKTTTGEDAEVFRRYLLMSLSRGTGLVELYLKTFELSESDWDVLADGMKWVHRVFPAFKRARMIGGDPKHGEVYGYTGWNEAAGYLSLHNPSDETREFPIVLDRTLGLPKSAVSGGRSYVVSTPFAADAGSLPKTATAGQTLMITLPPRAIRIMEYTNSAPGKTQ